LKILLTGRSGQVGWELERRLAALGSVLATDRASLDLGDAEALRRCVREAKPDLIVNAAAYTAVDKAEAEPAVADAINAIAPGVLAEEAQRSGARLVHYSTDYVFDGRRGSPYSEADEPHPLNVYGRTKLDGDRRIAASGCRHLVLRTSWVYAARGRNFYLTIVRKAAAGEALRVVDDQHGVPTPASFIAGCTLELLRGQASGLVNLVPSGSTTWYGFARAILEHTGARTSLEPIASAQFPTAARRPAYSVLDNARAARLLARPLPDWRSLLDVREFPVP
jgi:dTDP-4-dehydrorhamnose reductase